MRTDEDAVKAKGADGLTLAERLHKLKRERVGPSATYGEFAARCGAPENTAKDWLSGRSLPGGAYLRGIRKGFEVSADFVLDGVMDSGAPAETNNIHEIWRGSAPAGIPEPWREDYGALMHWIGQTLTDSPAYRTPREPRERKPTLQQAQDATLRIVTAMMAEIRRQRGERKQAPESLLEELRTYRGPQGLTMYLLWSRLAAELAIPRYHPSHASGTVPPRATKGAPRKAKASPRKEAKARTPKRGK